MITVLLQGLVAESWTRLLHKPGEVNRVDTRGGPEHRRVVSRCTEMARWHRGFTGAESVFAGNNKVLN